MVDARELLRRALAAHRAGDRTRAEALYLRLLRSAPNDVNPLHLLGVLYAQQRRFGEAERFMTGALRVSVNAEVLNSYGALLTEIGRLDEAIGHLKHALQLKPGYAEAHFNLGNSLRKAGQNEAAVLSFEAALKIRPGYTEAAQNLADSLRALSRQDEAITILRRAIDAGPPNAGMYRNLGIVLRDRGDTEEACRMFDKAIALDPGFLDAYYYRIRSSKVRPNDGLLAAMEGFVPRAGLMAPEERARLHFGLAKAYEDLERYDDAFASLREANRIMRALVGYDEPAAMREFDLTKQIFSPELLSAHAGSGSSSALPIFVVGFPRSGTTLVEQILGSHPAVHAAGELHLMPQLAASLKAEGNAYPACIPAITGEELQRLGDHYAAELRRSAPEALHITDKNPGNTMHLGLIHLALPRAKIIHVGREPLDSCFSCYSLRFAGEASSFIYEMGELGRRYNLYRELMDHWRRVLPANAMLDVHYEDVVENLEGEARRLIEFCGLAWDERCLSFHERRGVVRTASVAQVRQPLYRSSLSRWRRFERHLAPLIAIVGAS